MVVKEELLAVEEGRVNQVQYILVGRMTPYIFPGSG